MKSEKKSKVSNYIKEITKWQNSQYNPGAYTGGNLPPYITNPGKQKYLGWLLLIGSVISVPFFILMIIKGFRIYSLQLAMLPLIILLYGGLIGIQFIAGIRLIRTTPIKDTRRDIRKMIKTLLILIIIVVIIFTLFKAVDRFYQHENEIVIYSFSQVIAIQENKNYYIYIKERDIKIKCNEDEYRLFKSMRENTAKETPSTYKVTYRWSEFNKNRGTLINVDKL